MQSALNFVVCDTGLEAGRLGRELLERHPEQRVGSFCTRTEDFFFLTYRQVPAIRARRLLILPSVDQEDVNFRRAFQDTLITRFAPGQVNEIITLHPGDLVEQLMQYVQDDTGLPGYVPRW